LFVCPGICRSGHHGLSRPHDPVHREQGTICVWPGTKCPGQVLSLKMSFGTCAAGFHPGYRHIPNGYPNDIARMNRVRNRCTGIYRDMNRAQLMILFAPLSMDTIFLYYMIRLNIACSRAI